jgi:UPF0755 protein
VLSLTQPDETVAQPAKRETSSITKHYLVLLIVIVFFVIACLAILWYYYAMLKPINFAPSPAITVNIPAGANANQIASILRQKNLIRNENAFLFYLRVSGKDTQLKAGEYALAQSDSVQSIVEKIASGQVITYPFTIPEGFTLRQIAATLAEEGLVDKEEFLLVAGTYKFDYWFLEGLPERNNRLEGFLFPDTYRVSKGYSEKQIIDMMLRRFEQIYSEEYRQRAETIGFTTHQVITLASIIEKETRLDAERPIVSGVFHNRLAKNWRLESCATIQYLLDEPRERLTLADLAIDSKYNTYKHPGLPPGPIASPGRASIDAALNPAQIDYMFFVLKQDGSHAFARTLVEHNRNKNKYLKR